MNKTSKISTTVTVWGGGGGEKDFPKKEGGGSSGDGVCNITEVREQCIHCL